LNIIAPLNKIEENPPQLPLLQISLGRCTKEAQIDVDLSLEGPAWKISRRQGIIKLKNTGEFYIANEGKRPIYIDGKPVLRGNKAKLIHNSVVEVRARNLGMGLTESDCVRLRFG
jgi:flagellar basal body rod protein FlgG